MIGKSDGIGRGQIVKNLSRRGDFKWGSGFYAFRTMASVVGEGLVRVRREFENNS